MLRLGLVLCFLGACAAQMRQMPTDELCSMTPQTMMADFLNNCNDLVGNGTACMTFWANFSSAFSGIDPASVTPRHYSPYFMAIPIVARANESLFWSRTNSLVGVLSMMNAMGVNVVSSFNTISSLIVNNIRPSSGSQLNWCGNESGIDFFNRCLCNVTGYFWHQYSEEFARAAIDNNFFLTDGEDKDGAFRNNSFFSTVEIPSMRSGVVTRVVALIVHRQGVGENCTTGRSVQVLRSRIAERNFAFDCYDILAQASNPNTTNTTANCLRNVIDKVQMGKEDAMRVIPCNGSSDSGSHAFSVSMMGLLISFSICTLFKLN